MENSILEKVERLILLSGEARLDGLEASREIESRLVELGYKVSRDVCPVLLRNRLLVSRQQE